MKRDESDLQIQVADLLRLYEKPRRFVFTSAPNELMGQARTGAGLARMARFKRMGLRAGWSDLTIIRGGRAYLLELKVKGGILSANQKTFRDDAIHAAGEYAVAYSFDEAVDVLKIWGIVP